METKDRSWPGQSACKPYSFNFYTGASSEHAVTGYDTHSFAQN